MQSSRAPHALLFVLAGLAALLTATTVGALSRYERPGVTLFEDTDYRGRQETFFVDVPNLDRSPFSTNVASSIRVGPGCRITLYSEISFRGRSLVLTEDEPSLTRTRLGNDAVSSMRVYCDGRADDDRYDDGRDGGDHGGGGYSDDPYGDVEDRDYGNDDYDPKWRRGKGVVLFEREDFRGRRAFFGDDEADLGRSRFGNDVASSLRVAPGCEVTLYSDRGFRGRSVVLNRDQPSLYQTRIGNDRVSSLQVSCGGDPPWGGWGRRHGAVLYEDDDFRGRQEVIEGDDPNLRDNLLGSDRVSSVRVAPGCRVTLYRDANFRGTAAVLTYDTPTLSGTRIGNDSVSSIRIACQGDDLDWDGRGAVLFDDSDFRGRNEVVSGDIPRLRATRIGNDRVSSVRVAPGCQVILFADENFRGGSTVLTADAPSLAGSRVGNDGASSVRLECRGGDLDWGTRRGVRLYRDVDFRGRDETFYEDDADLGNNPIGSDRVSSIRVAPGCRAILYEDSRFRGRSSVITEDTPSLGRDRVGNDTVSSLRVECQRRR